MNTSLTSTTNNPIGKLPLDSKDQQKEASLLDAQVNQAALSALQAQVAEAPTKKIKDKEKFQECQEDKLEDSSLSDTEDSGYRTANEDEEDFDLDPEVNTPPTQRNKSEHKGSDTETKTDKISKKILTVAENIEEDLLELEKLKGSELIIPLMEESIPKLRDLLKEMVVKKCPYGTQIAASFTLNRLNNLIDQVLKANLLKITNNLIEKAKEHNKNGDCNDLSSLVFNLLDFLAARANTDLVKIQGSFNKANEKQKKQIFSAITEELLKIVFPEAEKSIVLPPVLTQFIDMRKIIYNLAANYIPTFLNELTTKLQATADSKTNNAAKIEKLTGGADLLTLIDTLCTRFDKIVNTVTSGQAKTAQSSDREIIKQLGSVAKVLGEGKSQAVNQIIEQLGNYCKPVLLHIFSNLSAGNAEEETPENKNEHILTRIIKNYLNTVFDFAEKNKDKIDRAYEQSAKKALSIEEEYKQQDLKNAKVQEEKQKELDKAFAPVYKILEGCVNGLMLNAGIDKQELAKILPFGAELAADAIQKVLLSRAFELYRDVIREEPNHDALINEIGDIKEAAPIVDKLIAGAMVLAKKKISDPESGTGKYLITLIQSFVLSENSKEEMFNLPIQELCNSAVYTKVEQFLQRAIQRNVINLLANLGTNCSKDVSASIDEKGKLQPRKAPEKLLVAGVLELAKLISSYTFEDKNFDLQKALNEWVHLPERTAEERKIKEDRKKELIASFNPLVRNILTKGGWDDPKNIIAPESKKELLVTLIRDQLLPELLFDLSSNLLIMNELPEDKQKEFKNLEDYESISKLAKYLAKKARPEIWSQVTSLCYGLGDTVNQDFTKGTLGIDQVVHLAANFSTIAEGLQKITPINEFIEGFLERIINYALTHGSVNALQNMENRPVKTNAIANILGLINTNFADESISKELRVDLEKYADDTIQIAKLKEQNKNLCNEALDLKLELDKTDKNSAPYAEKQQQLRLKEKEIEAKSEEVKKKNEEMKANKINENYPELLKKEIQPLMTTLLTNMGFKSAADLPVPYFLREILWKNLATEILPKLALDSYLNLSPAYRQRQTSIDNLKNRFGNLALKEAAEILAKVPLKIGNNYLTTQRGELSNWLQKILGFKPTVENILGSPHFKQKEVDKIQEANKEGFLFPVIEAELTGQILEVMDGATANLRQIEERNPAVNFDFFMDFMNLLTGHLTTVKESLKDQNKTQMKELDVAATFAKFQAKGQLDVKLQNRETELTNQIKAAKEDLKQVKETEPKNLAKIAEKTKILTDLEEVNFYEKFGKWLLNLAGKREQKDLHVPFGSKDPTKPNNTDELAWDKLHEYMPMGVKLLFSEIGNPKLVDTILLSLLTTINEELEKMNKEQKAASKNKTAQPVLPLTAKDREAQKQLTALIQTLVQALPNSKGASALRLMMKTPYLRSLPAAKIEPILAKLMAEWAPSKIMEKGLISAASKLGANLDKSLPTTPEDIAAKKAHDALDEQEKPEKIKEQTKKLIENSKNSLFKWLESSIIGRLFGWLWRPILNFIFNRMKRGAERDMDKMRQDIPLSIHQNLGFQIGRNLMKNFNLNPEPVVV